MFDVNELSNLAHIKLSDDEKKHLQKDLEEIIQFVGQINSVDINFNKETNFFVKNVLRDDNVQEFENVDLIIQNFPNKTKKAIKVKRIINSDE